MNKRKSSGSKQIRCRMEKLLILNLLCSVAYGLEPFSTAAAVLAVASALGEFAVYFYLFIAVAITFLLCRIQCKAIPKFSGLSPFILCLLWISSRLVASNEPLCC